MKEIIMMIRSRVEGYSHGQTGGNMMVSGSMGSSMERGSIILLKGMLEEENGKRANG